MQHLRYWCQKVLPLVYDDSLSYYELLCKVVAKVNELIGAIEVSEENIFNIVNGILTEWKNDGTLEEIINQDLFSDLNKKMKAGGTANIRQLFTSFYPYETSTGANPSVSLNGTSAYYVQGFAKTPNGFCIVRLAPESNKINPDDISQIFEFADDGSYIRDKAVNVHHGNGMVYYDGYLYVDVGSNVAKVKYSDLTIESYISLSGTCPALDREGKQIISVDSVGNLLYKYNLESGAISTVQLDPDCPDIYNGAYYQDGIFYGLTYMNDLVMIDVETGAFLGGKHVETTDCNNIRLLELEDLDTDEDGNVYVLSNQTHFSTLAYKCNDHSKEYQIRRAGFYVGQFYPEGGGSAENETGKHIHTHATDIYVANDSSASAEMDAKLEIGTQDAPFRSLAAASFFDGDARQINCGSYTTLYGADIYQPIVFANYGLINNLSVDTDFPLAIKGYTGYVKGGVISITDYGISLSYCDIVSVDIDLVDMRGDLVGVLYNGVAEITPAASDALAAAYIVIRQAELDGGNLIPIGACTTNKMKYTNQAGTSGAEATLTTPLLGGARGTRLALLDRTTPKYVIYSLYGDTLYGSDGSTVSLTENDRTTGTIKFTAPFSFDRVDVF